MTGLGPEADSLRRLATPRENRRSLTETELRPQATSTCGQVTLRESLVRFARAWGDRARAGQMSPSGFLWASTGPERRMRLSEPSILTPDTPGLAFLTGHGL
jgi:hypothetical protein